MRRGIHPQAKLKEELLEEDPSLKHFVCDAKQECLLSVKMGGDSKGSGSQAALSHGPDPNFDIDLETRLCN